MERQKISITGLGYVGLPVAIAFSQKNTVIGFDKNPKRIEELKKGFDRTGETSKEDLKQSNITFTVDPQALQQSNFHIIAVPTPIDEAKRPNLKLLLSATKTLAEQLKKGDTVVYESTVYPGTTEEECIPILEKYSKLKSGKDFYVGYSPERINPGDKKHSFTNIVKIVSGQDKETLEIIAKTYSSVVKAGIHKASSIKVAEAAKIIENTQRDLNIALMNELALIFKRLKIDTSEVLTAANTKWNFLPFKPGLVGGHCIGVDPYYLTYKAEQLNYHPEVILAGRRINDTMGHFIAEQTVLQMTHRGLSVKDANVTILGLTFKEDCPDIRNTRVIDVIKTLQAFGTKTFIHDPLADPKEARRVYHVELTPWDELPKSDAIIICVAHQDYVNCTPQKYCEKLIPDGIIVDIKSILNPNNFKNTVWRL